MLGLLGNLIHLGRVLSEEERGKENNLFENTELTLFLSSPQGPMASLCPQDYDVPSSHKALDPDLPASVAKSHFRAFAQAAPSTWSALLTPIPGLALHGTGGTGSGGGGGAGMSRSL